jgi:hypothetical protein
MKNLMLTFVTLATTAMILPPTHALAQAEAPRHEFSPSLVQRIVTPDPTKAETFDASKPQDLIQYPVIPGLLMEGLMKSLDQSQSIKRQMQHRYGLNSYNVSYIESQPDTWAQVGDHRTGVSPNCFLCHSTFINGQFVPGLGNTRIDLKTFFDDLVFRDPMKNFDAVPALAGKIKTFYKEQKNPGLNTFLDRTALTLSVWNFVTDINQQSTAAGHANPWGFAEFLVNWRDNNMDYWESKSLLSRKSGRGFKAAEVVLDPMPWWQLKYKEYINWDGLIKKAARVVVQASLSPGRSGSQIRGMDGLFSNIYEEIHRMEPPVYPKLKDLDPTQVARGEIAFNKHCSECHGKHSEAGTYYRDPKDFRDPSKGNYHDEIIHFKHLKTDPARVMGMSLPYINALEKTWLAHYGEPDFAFRTRALLKAYLAKEPESAKEAKSIAEIADYCSLQKTADCTNRLTEFMKRKIYGYQVPPLWGIWASAPYLHNGSVPNLRAILFPDERPKAWKLIDDPQVYSAPYTPYNVESPGLVTQVVKVNGPTSDSKLYNTQNKGCSNEGHNIMDWSGPEEKPIPKDTKEDILVYLKTL